MTEDGTLQGVKMTYYTDCGINPNDNGLPPGADIGLENGNILIYRQPPFPAMMHIHKFNVSLQLHSDIHNSQAIRFRALQMLGLLNPEYST